MTPVISPWVFYWIPVLDSITFIAGLLLLLSIILFVIVFFMFCMELDMGDEDSDLAKLLKKAKDKLLVIIAVTTLITVFVPSETTVTKMLIAQNVTYERVEVVSDTIINTVETVYNDIMNLFDKSSDSNG